MLKIFSSLNSYSVHLFILAMTLFSLFIPQYIHVLNNTPLLPLTVYSCPFDRHGGRTPTDYKHIPPLFPPPPSPGISLLNNMAKIYVYTQTRYCDKT